MKRIALAFLVFAVGALGGAQARQRAASSNERPGRSQTAPTTEPTVRIGLNQNLQTVMIRSAQAFTVQGNTTRTARFVTILSLDPASASRTLTRADLQYRMMIELDSGRVLVQPLSTKVRIAPAGTPLRIDQIENRTYRGTIEVFGNSRNTFTVVNELPMEEYLLGVVPNELSPTTFGQIEALKAQAVAARTYIVRNMGQFRNEEYD
ncbi:MAG: hypothetical protein HY646_03335, partial [Acidobacteria bacterium]|nr:hypothetical protein [Acidobacteriota bacterium]